MLNCVPLCTVPQMMDDADGAVAEDDEEEEGAMLVDDGDGQGAAQKAG